MKLVIASDIHGSAIYCRKVLDAYRAEKGEKLLLLGDILYHGPRNDLPEGYAPKEVIPMLNEIKNEILCVRGNCDTEVDQMVLEFPILADSCILYAGGRMIYATHGHNYNLQKRPPLHPRDVLLHGHTHIPACEEQDGILYVNPGSASIPKNGSWHGYMTLEDGLLLWKNFEGQEQLRYEL